MHSYLRAVGFSDIHNITQLNKLIEEIVRGRTEKRVFESEDGRVLAEISREFGEGFGLTVVGEYDRNSMFYAEYVFPYLKGTCESSPEPVVVEKHVANDSCCGACDDLRVGATLIFYLRNMGEYIIRSRRGAMGGQIRATIFTALSKDGTVLLPVEKSEEEEEEDRKDSLMREELLQAARDGDEDAIEYLSEEDYDLYTKLIERASREDVLTIVDSYFMPNGSDCECYSILGTILDVEQLVNGMTGAQIVKLGIEANGIRMDVGMNAADLVGEPQIGRRFKGTIWLQGEVLYND